MPKRRHDDDDTSARSLFGFGLLGILNACILLSPLHPDMQAKLAATLNPTISLLAFILYRLWDRYMVE